MITPRKLQNARTLSQELRELSVGNAPPPHRRGGQSFPKAKASWYLRGSGEDLKICSAIRFLNVSCRLLLLFVILAIQIFDVVLQVPMASPMKLFASQKRKAFEPRAVMRHVVQKLAALNCPPRYATAHDVSDREVWVDNGQIPG